MASFAEQIRSKVREAENAPQSQLGKQFLDRLNELVEGLSSLDVGAALERGLDPRRLTLYMFPKHRPSRKNAMLVFVLDTDYLSVLGASLEKFYAPDQLEDWLLRFVNLPTFIESLEVLREDAGHDVEARLRTRVDLDYNRDDVLVVVSAEDQSKLGEAEQNKQVEVDVERLDFPGNPPLDETRLYVLLESAGLQLVLPDLPKRNGNRFRLTGIKRV